jgi:hypothetical protein
VDRRAFLVGTGAVAVAALGRRSFAGAATAPAFYVSPRGADRNAGTSAAPWRTLANVPAVPAGSRVYLARGGVWHEELRIVSRGVCVTGWGKGSQPVIDGSIGTNRRSNGITVDSTSDVIIDGLEVRGFSQNLVKLRNARRVTVRNARLHGCNRNGVQANIGGGDHIIQACEIFDIGEHCAYGEGNAVQFLSTTTGANRVRGCYIHDVGRYPGDHGIYSIGGTGNRFEHNRFERIAGTAVKVVAGSSSSYVGSNSMTDCRAAATCVHGALDARIENNIATRCGAFPTGFSPFVAWWFLNPQGSTVLLGNTATGSGIGIQVTGGSITSDYNKIKATLRWGALGTGDVQTLGDWQGATGQDRHSLQS